MKLSTASLGLAVVLLAIVGTVLAQKEEFEAVRTKCMEKNDISEAEFEEVKEKAESMNPDDVDEKFKCFSHCLADEMGFLDEAGKFDLKKLEDNEHVQQEHIDTAIKCKAEHDFIDDPCEYTFQMMKCGMESMSK